MIKKIAIQSLILSSILSTTFNIASAAGFAVMEQSVTGLGDAFSGGGASAIDSSTIFYNPAGMSRLSGTQSAGGIHYILPNAEFSNSGSRGIAGPLSGRISNDGGEEAVLTNFYITSKITDSIHVGLGINAPFGLATQYSDDWVGRYHAISSVMQTVNLNPSISFAFNDKLSVGVGFNAQYLHLRLTSAVDYGTICAGSAASNSCGALGLNPQSLDSDGIAKINGDSWGFGFNVGVLYEPIQGTRVGLAYRYHLHHTIKGDARYDNKPLGAQQLFANPNGPFQETSAAGELDLPETLSFSIFHELNNQWSVQGDITWTNWSRFEELRIDYGNPSQPTTVIEEKWDDVFRYAIGVSYALNSDLTFRAGTAYDQTPIASALYRTPRIPDNNRYWLSIGASYKPTTQLTLDFAYAHVFMHDSEVNNTDSLGHTLAGTFSTDADIISIQARWMF